MNKLKLNMCQITTTWNCIKQHQGGHSKPGMSKLSECQNKVSSKKFKDPFMFLKFGQQRFLRLFLLSGCSFFSSCAKQHHYIAKWNNSEWWYNFTAEVPQNVLGYFYTSIQWTNRICYCFTASRYSSGTIYLKSSGDLRKSKKFENRSSLGTSFVNKIKVNINKASNYILLFYSSTSNSEAAHQ